MAARQTIAIIGANGNMGSAFAKALVNTNYRLLLMSRNTDKLANLSACLKRKNSNADVEIVECVKDGCWEADIILMAVPYSAEKAVADKIREVATQKVVISISNPLNETYDHLITDPTTSAAEELQNVLPHSKVVKAFNTVFAADISRPNVEGKQEKTFLAGNDNEALQIVGELATVMGFKPVLCGSLSDAKKLEQMILQLIELKREENYNRITGWDTHSHAPITFKSVNDLPTHTKK
jgi:hypothetical protein